MFTEDSEREKEKENKVYRRHRRMRDGSHLVLS